MLTSPYENKKNINKYEFQLVYVCVNPNLRLLKPRVINLFMDFHGCSLKIYGNGSCGYYKKSIFRKLNVGNCFLGKCGIWYFGTLVFGTLVLGYLVLGYLVLGYLVLGYLVLGYLVGPRSSN